MAAFMAPPFPRILTDKGPGTFFHKTCLRILLVIYTGRKGRLKGAEPIPLLLPQRSCWAFP